MKPLTEPVLVAVPIEWRALETQLVANRFPHFIVYSKQAFLQALNSQTFSAFAVISDWVIDDLDSPSLIEQMNGEMPTLTIITEESRKKYGYQAIDKTYLSAMHQFCTVPFDVAELIGGLNRAFNAFDKS